MKTKFILLSFLLFLFLFPAKIWGQCQVHEIAQFGRLFATSGRIGQTFKPCSSGEITNINIYLSTLGEHNLWIGAPNGGLLSNFQQTFNVIDRGLLNLPLKNGFPIEEGQEYEFQIQVIPSNNNNNSNLTGYQETNFGPHYPDGVFTLDGRRVGFRDLNFSLAIEKKESIIPTFSQWGLLIYGLLILNLGSFILIQMEKSPNYLSEIEH